MEEQFQHKKKLSWAMGGLLAIGLACGFLYGFLSAYYKYPPYHAIFSFYEKVARPAIGVKDPPLDPLYRETDPASLITLFSIDDVEKRREEIKKIIWKDLPYPINRMPDVVEKNGSLDDYASIQNVGESERLEIRMEYGMTSIAYLLYPKDPDMKKLLIYHVGHVENQDSAKPVVQHFINEGYTVMVFNMPLYGPNKKPLVKLPRQGVFRLEHHDDLYLLKTEKFSPMKFFAEPVVVGVNYAESKGYANIVMVGLSGGGWQATLSAAIDPRIKRSYPVAGSLPLYLRQRARTDEADYEQALSEIYNKVNYLELYTMGAVGEGRGQLQVFNKYDNCCFAGERPLLYKDAVIHAVAKIGSGSFDVFIDKDQYSHIVSEQALQLIDKDIITSLEGD